MKRILSIIGCVIVLAASSCTKKYITPNTNKTIQFTVKSAAWTTTDGGKTYSATINVQEINNVFNEIGGVLVYFSFTDGVYEQVPEVYQGISYSYTHNANPGSLVLYAQSSDGLTPIAPPDDMVLKLLLIDSNQ